MVYLINGVIGEIRNPVRMLQLKKICDLYNIPVLSPAPLTYKGYQDFLIVMVVFTLIYNFLRFALLFQKKIGLY